MIINSNRRQNKLFLDAIKIVLVTICVSAIALTGLFVLFACDDNTDEPYTEGDEVKIDKPITNFEIENYTIPENLPSYALTIEWVYNDGGPVNFNPNKPSVILFSGLSKYDKKDSYKLPDDIYSIKNGGSTNNILSSFSTSINLELAHYWRLLGFNVGIFHYENFADDTHYNINKKIYSSDEMTYIDKDGNLIEDANLEFTLTEAFVMEWMKLVTSSKNIGNDGTVPPNKLMELRLIGNGSGANLAVAVAEYLSNLARYNYLKESKSPTRVTLIDAWLDNEKINLNVDYKTEGIDSILNYNSSIITELFKRGIVFEVIETDSEFYYRYKDPYTGLVPASPNYDEPNTIEPNEEQLGITGDSAKYNSILKSSASLYLRESYSLTYYTDEYKELQRSGLDWYLYSARGTDNTSIVYNGTVYSSYTYAMGYEGSAPVLDDYYETFSSSFVRYGVSAWTPTPYISSISGVAFKCITKGSSNSDGVRVPTSYTLTQFQSEAYQVSNKSGIYIVGFVTSSKDSTNYLNLGESTRMRGVKLIVTFTISGAGSAQTTYDIEVTTDSRGYFELKLKDEEVGLTTNLQIEVPHGYSIITPNTGSGKMYEKLGYATLGADKITISIPIDANKYPLMYYFYNAVLE
ncbi:MAG: hypothetical protein LBF12_07800 [Christensenellaceae bacterium]|jgi:hypothetical protein|nr:hypothetical protein [Christensenellaceae bacterium]